MAPNQRRHVIKGHILTVSSPDSQPGDPLDDSSEAASSPPPDLRISRKHAKTATSPQESLPSTSRSSVQKNNSTSPSVSQQQTVFPVIHKKLDIDLISHELLQQDTWSIGEESHSSECSSARTSVDRYFDVTISADELVMRFGERVCDFCSSGYHKTLSKRSKRFCSLRCYERRAELPIKLASKKKPSITTSIRKSDGITSRRSTRPRKRPSAFHEAAEHLDSDDNASSSTPTTVSSRSTSDELSDVTRRNSASKTIQRLKIQGNVSEASFSRATTAAAAAKASPVSSQLRLKSSASTGKATRDVEHNGQKRLRVSARVPTIQEQNLLKGKSDSVKRRITEKPLILWDIDDVGAFGEDIDGDNGWDLAFKLMLNGVDGQSLVLFDQSQVWTTLLIVDSEPAEELVYQVKLLKKFQHDALKGWWRDRLRQLREKVAILDRKSR